MAEYYVEADAVAGGITGAGTSGDPWTGLGGNAIIQYAIDNGTWSTADGNVLHLSTHEPYILAANIDFGVVFSTNDGVDNPMVWAAWTGGTSDTTKTTYPNGESIPVFEIDGNDAVTDLIIGTNTYVTFVYGKFHDGTGTIAKQVGWSFIFCEVYAMGSTTYQLSGANGHIYGCWIHSGDGGASQSCLKVGGTVANCLVEDATKDGIEVNRSHSTTVNNVVNNCAGKGIVGAGDSIFVAGNTVTEDGSTASTVGIRISDASGHDASFVVENLIVHLDGTSAIALSTSASGTVALHLRNHFFNNTLDVSSGAITYDDDGTVNTVDPVPNAATGDFTVNAVAEAYKAALTVFAQRGNQHIGASQFGVGRSRRPRLQIQD